MNEQIQLYSFLRSGASIYLARLDKVEVQTDEPGQEKISLRLLIEQTLWGLPGASTRHAQFTQPDSEPARLKFPHPLWGQVSMQKGVLVFLVTHELTKMPADPVYVEEIADPQDAVLGDIKKILDEERIEAKPSARKPLYLTYLTEGGVVEKLFGAEALAKDLNNLEEDQTNQIAVAMAEVFSGSESVYVRLSVGTWMSENIYPRAGLAGKAAVINAALKGLEDASEDIRRYSLNFLANVDTGDLGQPLVVSSPASVLILQKHQSAETSPEIRDQFQKMVDVLTRKT